jgi:SAM-dependent methyltransferase
MASIEWDQRYASESYFYGTEPNDFLREQFELIARGGRVLCLAEGEGRNAVFLAGHGYEVVAIDQSLVGLQKVDRLAAAKGVRVQTVCADLADYTIEPDAWDGIVSIWCHLPHSLRAQVHRQVVWGLKHRGVFLLEAYTPAQLHYKTGGPPCAELLPTLQELRQELTGLDLVRAVELDRVIAEGQRHNGLSAVVQIIAHRRH